MTYIKWTFRGIVFLLLASFLHYTLPQHDIVRVVNTEVQRIDPGNNSFFWASGDAGSSVNATGSRDVRFIETIMPNGEPMVYRNEDTGWGWPPFFKFDSSNLQARARDVVSTSAEPQWVALKHYGWRNEWFSIFPNAVNIRTVEGPDARVFPLGNTIILTILAILLAVIWRLWLNFRRARIDPVIEDASEAWDGVEDRAASAKGRLSRWFSRK